MAVLKRFPAKTHESFHIHMRVDLQEHNAKAKHENQDADKHTATHPNHILNTYTLEEKMRAHARSNTRAHLDACSDLLSLLLFFCLAFHVQSLVCDSCLSAEDRRREHNLCDGVEVKKEKKRWQNEWKAGENV